MSTRVTKNVRASTLLQRAPTIITLSAVLNLAGLIGCGGSGESSWPTEAAPRETVQGPRIGDVAGPGLQPREIPIAQAPKQSEREKEQIAAIQWAINKNNPAVHRCYAVARAKDLSVQGEVQLMLEVADKGAVASVTATRDTAGEPRLTECLVASWKKFVFPPVFDVGDKISLPPFSFVGGEQYVISTEDAARASDLDPKAKVGVISVLSPLNSGNGDALLDVITLKTGARLEKQPSESILYILSGTGRVSGKGQRVSVKPGIAVSVPKDVEIIFQGSSEPDLVLVRSVVGRVSLGNTKKIRKSKRSRLVGYSTAKAKEYSIFDGKGTARILVSDKKMYLGALTFAPDINVPKHKHDDASEFLYILEGQGELYIGDTAHTVRGGDAIQIPKGTVHAFIGNTELSTKPIKTLQWYVPGGPEKRFLVGSTK